MSTDRVTNIESSLQEPLVRMKLAIAVLLVLFAGLAIRWDSQTVETSSQTATVPIGATIDNVLSLRDARGTLRPLHDWAGYRAIVLAFMGTQCPLANLYMPTLKELERTYRDQGVLFVAVFPNSREDIREVAGHAEDHQLPFPVVKDYGQKCADSLGITRTPEVVVLDERFRLRYRGRIDDRYGIGARKTTAQRRDLVEAIDQVLAGEEVTVAQTTADGCLIDRRVAETTEPLTYCRDIAPIIQNRCQSCHRPGQIGPFSLLRPQDAVQWADMIAEVVEQRRMPPWSADPRYGHFSNDPSLTDTEITKIRSWVKQGAPLGDPADLPPPRQWPEKWGIGEPDQIIQPFRPYAVPADGVGEFVRFRVPSGFQEDRWIAGMEVQPQRTEVVHHIDVNCIPPGVDYDDVGSTSFIGGWVPGSAPLRLPADTAILIPKGMDIVLQVHYTPNGITTSDRSRLGLKFAPQPPKHRFLQQPIGFGTKTVPANNPRFAQQVEMRFTDDATLYALQPHMHLRGHAAHFDLIDPEGVSTRILSVPAFDFNWQFSYRFAEPLQIRRGSILRLTGIHDNSRANPRNPDPFIDVRHGPDTLDEMMTAVVSYVPASQTKVENGDESSATSPRLESTTD